MINEKTVNRITKVIPKKVLTELQDISVIENSPGSYCLYNQYNIDKVGQSFVVTTNTTATEMIFNTMKSAVAWCSCDKRNMIVQAKRIAVLDFKLGSVETDIVLHSHMLKKAKSDDEKLIYAAKLTEEKFKKRQITTELGVFVDESVTWQAKRWNKKP